MTIAKESPAVTVARAHALAWSNHDFAAARAALAPDVGVMVTSTNDALPSTDLTGIDAYMQGLEEFARGVVPGTLVVNATLGDEHNALLMVTVEAAFGPDAPRVTLPAARLYLLDENGKIKAERVVFFAAPN